MQTLVSSDRYCICVCVEHCEGIREYRDVMTDSARSSH